MFPPTIITSPPEPRPWRASVRRAVDLAVAFVTLESYTTEDVLSRLPGTRGTVTDPGLLAEVTELHEHPHRRPLRAPTRSGRPGAAPARVQLCTTPLDPRPRRRAPQGSPASTPARSLRA